MGLGVEHFTGWEGEDAQDVEDAWSDPTFDGWAPSADPYVDSSIGVQTKPTLCLV